MTVNEFIKRYFIEEIGSLVELHPFIAFTLISIGIEFLGKCLNSNKWDDRREKSGEIFNDAIKSYATLTKYSSIPLLYENLRCGLAHKFMVNGTLILGPEQNDLTSAIITIGCKEFYADFKQACLDAISNTNGLIKKNLSDQYDFEVDGYTGSTKVASVTTIE